MAEVLIVIMDKGFRGFSETFRKYILSKTGSFTIEKRNLAEYNGNEFIMKTREANVKSAEISVLLHFFDFFLENDYFDKTKENKEKFAKALQSLISEDIERKNTVLTLARNFISPIYDKGLVVDKLYTASCLKNASSNVINEINKMLKDS